MVKSRGVIPTKKDPWKTFYPMKCALYMEIVI